MPQISLRPLARHNARRQIVFLISLEENGQLSGASWSIKGEARYALLPAWDGQNLRGVDAPGDVAQRLGAQAAATAEDLFEMRGGLLGLKPGELLQFYVKELKSQGSASDGNGSYSWTETIKDGLWQLNGCGGTSTDQEQYADLADATLVRTPNGATLRFSWKLNTGCDFGAGANHLGFSGAEAGQVLTFRLSEEDLCDWDRVRKTNQGTIHGTPGDDSSYPVNLRATLRGEPGRPEEAEVTLDGCSELGEGGEGRAAATGRPEGGSYRFWAEPEEILAIEANGASAVLRGVSPDRGTLHVEYTSPEGNTAQASRPAACVKVESINGGEPIPQISLFDGNGKRVPGIRTIPVTVRPADAADLLDYVPADPAVLSAVNLGDSIQLQGVREGKTTLQARIKCSGMLGPVVTVEVAPCDEETIARLAEESRIATEAQKAAEKDFMDALGSKEFEEASDNIADSTGNLLIKTGGLIIGTLGGAGGASKAARTASSIYGVGSNLLDTLKGGDALSQVSNVSQMIVELGGSAMQQAISGTIETLQAATEFGKHLGSLMSTADRMAAAAKWHEHWGRVIEDIVRRQKICRKGTGEPPQQEEPPAEPKPPKTDPKKPTPKPTEPTPKTEPPPGQEPPVQEPPGGEPPSDEPPISPPPPTSPPRQVGLPYDPGNCGCNKTQGIGASQAGLSTLQTGLGRLGECVETFRSGPLTGYLQTLKEWSAISTKLGVAAKAGGAELKATAKQVIPDIESLLTRTKSFDVAGRAFYEGFKTCPKSMDAGVSVLKSSKEIVGAKDH